MPHYASPAAGRPRAPFPPQQPEQPEATWRHAIRRLLKRLNPARRKRSNPRVIKRKISKWLAKREHHSRWPQPQHEAHITIKTLN
ncbi:hypothetical protein E3T53_12220 [Cryobacterium psychrophilum]|uniref:Uncharacterized protein n=1 Tax=Cryobacterium psychrophilum TaxID=41988 RepID=A0A4Y8KRV2_9MICO|nr:hypothetical protein E3T53_12220 [Cryobacterium psychrophilum]